MSQKQWSKSDIKSFIEHYPYVSSFLDKKSSVFEKDGLLFIQKKPFFFSKDAKWFPTLHLLLDRPNLLPSVTVDKGAIRFVVNGADIMRPGITAAQSAQKGDVVVIVDETLGKPIAVGELLVSSEELLASDSGKVVKNLHRIGDEIWSSV